MNSIWYGLAMMAILFVVHWFVSNDTSVDKTHGIFAMKRSAGATRKIRKKFSLRPEPRTENLRRASSCSDP
jgi:hypothetical protein